MLAIQQGSMWLWLRSQPALPGTGLQWRLGETLDARGCQSLIGSVSPQRVLMSPHLALMRKIMACAFFPSTLTIVEPRGTTPSHG